MEENEQPESNTEKITEVQAEAPVADDMEAAETVSAGTQNNSNSSSEQTVQATESSEPVVSEPKQVEAADAEDIINPIFINVIPLFIRLLSSTVFF